MNILYSLQHLGYVIPPQADAGWIGEAGPGPSYLDPGSGGPDNDFTNRNTTFMTWNLLHLARMLKDAGGIPDHGNQRSEWDAGCRLDFETPTTAEVAHPEDAARQQLDGARATLADAPGLDAGGVRRILVRGLGELLPSDMPLRQVARTWPRGLARSGRSSSRSGHGSAR